MPNGSLAIDWLPEAYGTRVPVFPGEQDFLGNINGCSFNGTFENLFAMWVIHWVGVN